MVLFVFLFLLKVAVSYPDFMVPMIVNLLNGYVAWLDIL
jgi:hypothetical protein